MGNYSMREMRLMMGRGTSLTARAMSGLTRGLGDLTGGAFGRGYSTQEANTMLGYGVTPKFMERQSFERVLTQNRERRQRYYRALYGGQGWTSQQAMAQYGRDAMGAIGLGDLHDNRYFRRGINFLSGAAQIGSGVGIAQGLYDAYQGKGFFASSKIYATGEEFEKDRRRRETIRTAKQLEGTMDRIVGGGRFSDQRFGQGATPEMAYRVAQNLADPSRLRGLASQEEIKKFKAAIGAEKGYFTTGESAQLMASLAKQGEFEGLETTMKYDPATGRMMSTEDLSTPEGRRRAKRQFTDRLSLAQARATTRIASIQKRYGFEKPEDAERFSRLLKGDGKVSDITDDDEIRIRNIKKRLGLSMKAISSILEMGNDISKQMGITKAMGQTIALQNVSAVRNLQRMGGVSQRDVRRMGGEQGFSQRLMKFRTDRLSTMQGKMHRGAVAMAEEIRLTDRKTAAEVDDMIRKDIQETGMIRSSTFLNIANRAGRGVTQADIPEFLERNELDFDLATKGRDVESEALITFAKRAKDRFAKGNVPIHRQKSRMQRFLKQRGVDPKLAATLVSTDLGQWEKAIKKFGKQEGLPEAVDLLADLNKQLRKNEIDFSEAREVLTNKIEELGLPSNMRTALLSKLSNKGLTNADNIFRKITKEIDEEGDSTSLFEDMQVPFTKERGKLVKDAQETFDKRKEDLMRGLEEGYISKWARDTGKSRSEIATLKKRMKDFRQGKGYANKEMRVANEKLEKMLKAKDEEMTFKGSREYMQAMEKIQKEQIEAEGGEVVKTTRLVADNTKNMADQMPVMVTILGEIRDQGNRNGAEAARGKKGVD
jgi:hypothetical protein